MAYPRDHAYSAALAVTSISVSSMPAHQTDDLILFFVSKHTSSGGAWTTPSGYTQIHNTQAGAVSVAAFYKVATSSSEAIPSSSTTDPDELYCMVASIADIDTADPINISASGTQGADNTHTAPSMTTDEDNTINVWWQVNDSTEYPSVSPGVMAFGLGSPQPLSTATQ